MTLLAQLAGIAVGTWFGLKAVELMSVGADVLRKQELGKLHNTHVAANGPLGMAVNVCAAKGV